ncbi:hypothetical protein GOBAR_AA06396 [Gossypium barbadense]|uniref:Uncharacterized protein n=1 Tax=Gossypium barbadense TaxID=3634 RepID=A0A2P5YF12_GOSBA|nr:hypothetical protein GOBAR_AA06396 [Gossypium barbadense]
MESVQLEHENVTEFVLVTLRDKVEERRRFSNEEKDPMTSKELNEEPYEFFIKCPYPPAPITSTLIISGHHVVVISKLVSHAKLPGAQWCSEVILRGGCSRGFMRSMSRMVESSGELGASQSRWVARRWASRWETVAPKCRVVRE